jgi:hypothetical protein
MKQLIKQLWNQELCPKMLRKLLYKSPHRPLWLGIIICAIGGVLLGSTLSRAVQRQFAIATATPSSIALRQTNNVLDSARRPRRRSSFVARRLPGTVVNRSSQLLDVSNCSANPRQPRNPTELKALLKLPLTRFRATANQISGPVQERSSVAHFTNFGWRFLVDWFGASALHEPIVVLHETVGSFESVMSLFGQSHPADEVQVSYHALIRENGAIVYVVPPEYRAYGAGDSVFINADRQEETVQTNGKNPPSVNNFAYHISLVTPADGRNNRATHGGYTKNQYEALAWLVAKTGIADDRITTHKIVDRSGTRTDPRSFNPEYFLQRLHSYPKTQEIIIGCTLPDAPAPPNLAQ